MKKSHRILTLFLLFSAIVLTACTSRQPYSPLIPSDVEYQQEFSNNSCRICLHEPGVAALYTSYEGRQYRALYENGREIIGFDTGTELYQALFPNEEKDKALSRNCLNNTAGLSPEALLALPNL